ncbi:hypothetical protein G6F62_013647 [Rhizopus arrhizus]|nr:hypothetical protein G6F62_013647 [Rhizopus arrhizus]
MPNQPDPLSRSSPASRAVGTSAMMGLRSACSTASPRSWPVRIRFAAAGTATMAASVSPASRATTAGPAPLYGTCSSVSGYKPCRRAKAIWLLLPYPGVPTFTSRWLPSRRSPAMSWMSESARTTITGGVTATMPTGAKLRSAS